MIKTGSCDNVIVVVKVCDRIYVAWRRIYRVAEYPSLKENETTINATCYKHLIKTFCFDRKDFIYLGMIQNSIELSIRLTEICLENVTILLSKFNA